MTSVPSLHKLAAATAVKLSAKNVHGLKKGEFVKILLLICAALVVFFVIMTVTGLVKKILP